MSNSAGHQQPLAPESTPGRNRQRFRRNTRATRTSDQQSLAASATPALQRLLIEKRHELHELAHTLCVPKLGSAPDEGQARTTESGYELAWDSPHHGSTMPCPPTTAPEPSSFHEREKGSNPADACEPASTGRGLSATLQNFHCRQCKPGKKLNSSGASPQTRDRCTPAFGRCCTFTLWQAFPRAARAA